MVTEPKPFLKLHNQKAPPKRLHHDFLKFKMDAHINSNQVKTRWKWELENNCIEFNLQSLNSAI